jgi:nicotinate-nucleotide--dimethylbenzimidazole phosphoribosyltransferase
MTSTGQARPGHPAYAQIGGRDVPAPDEEARRAARERLDGLAKPLGALGRLEDLATWLAGVQGRCPPDDLPLVRVVVLAGDHGVTAADHAGVSAYPREVTALMARAFLDGVAAICVLARSNGATVRVCDLGIDADPAGLPAEVTRHKVRRGSGAIDHTDALTTDEVEAALAAGATIADEEVDAGADLLVPGDMGIGNTTVAATLTAAVLGLPAEQVVGGGTGIDAETRVRKTATVERALARVSGYDDPVALLRAAGSADLAAMVALLVRAAERRTPVLLDGVVSGAAALVARELAPGAEAWWCAGHRSTEPAHHHALAGLGLEPVLDLGMRLGEGTGALTALPVLRAAGRLLAGMATLEQVVGR